ncbi:hypothetical protein [Glycomyces salinus]|uniref:hypothetical protein n=1 Tax=Glycomyces salinus TaxID=980294 RepID=UPI0018EE2C45|nr:hypothetical protein [Glycomyces salinus]
MAGRRSFDRASRWPWGVWFALVGVSAGTVASFALVGWVFVSASGPGEATGAAGATGWAEETVVLEATPEAWSVPRPEPSADRPQMTGPAAELDPGPARESSPEPDPEPEAEAVRPEESDGSEDDPRLVPLPPVPSLEERQECERPDRPDGPASPDIPEPSPSDTYSSPVPSLEHEDGTSPRPKG